MPPKKKQSKETTPCAFKKFPRRQIHELMVQSLPDGEVNENASAYIRSIMEYLAVEVLELSVNTAKTRLGNTKEVELTKDDVMEAINSDKELKELVENTKGSKSKE